MVIAGCEERPAAPSDGDLRLVPLNASVASTAVCDDIHFGAVEMFREGRWGRICKTGSGDPIAFTIDAQIVCRQLGFPFGTAMDDGITVITGDDPIYASDYDVPDPSAVSWASDVRFTHSDELRSNKIDRVLRFFYAATVVSQRLYSILFHNGRVTVENAAQEY